MVSLSSLKSKILLLISVHVARLATFGETDFDCTIRNRTVQCYGQGTCYEFVIRFGYAYMCDENACLQLTQNLLNRGET